MKSLRVCVVGLLLCLAQAGHAEYSFRTIDEQLYPDTVTYNPSIPTPESFLGRPLGRAAVRHHELVSYINTVARLSPRLSVEVAGYSHERRPILFVVATSSDNQSRIDEIQAQHLALTDPSPDQEITQDMPVVTWLNYGVHGAESSGMDAALPTIYYLAAAQGSDVDRLLRESVILITAVFNPDGHAYRAAWLDAWGSEVINADPSHIEHNYDGRMARTNHYGFDLNRQWLSVTQPEARAWMSKWHAWRPNVSVDYHEMRSSQTYYFAPGVPTRTHPLIPRQGYELIAGVVAPSEAFMDEQSRLYFHGDRYDHFYLGKGAAFPMVNGGLGILHEASAARGVELETVNGLRSYRENILKHFRTSIGNAMGSVNSRRALLEYQKSFYDGASERARKHPVKAYVFNAPGDRARTQHLVELLNFHRIEVRELATDVTREGFTFSAGDAFVVRLDQPQHTLIRSMFERMTEFDDKTFYDVSSWTVPLAFGVDHVALTSAGFSEELAGAPVAARFASAPVPDTPHYAYAFEWSDYYAPKALWRVLDAGLHARVALNSLAAQTTRGDVELDRGAIIVSFDRQPVDEEAIFELMQTIAAEDGIAVHALTSGRSAIGTRGPDVGGQFYRALEKPQILLLVGRDMDLYNAGEIWHLLDARMGIPVTLRDRSRLGSVDLNQYTHIVFAGGRYGSYSPAYLEDLQRWVRDGGTLIGIRQGAQWAQETFLKSEATDETAETAPDAAAEETPRFDYAQKETRDPLDLIGGAIFAGDLDNTHPLGFGYARRQIALHKNRTEVLERPSNPYASVVVYDQPALLSGYASRDNQEILAGTAAVIAERVGDGSVLLYADDPNFRGIWYGSNKLFLNALFFSKAFDAPRD